MLEEEFSDWTYECIRDEKEFLKNMKERKVFITVLCQEAKYLQDFADIIYNYGIAQSDNDGYYSLPFLCRILSEMIYHNF